MLVARAVKRVERAPNRCDNAFLFLLSSFLAISLDIVTSLVGMQNLTGGTEAQSATSASHDQNIYIRVRRSLLQPISSTTINPPPSETPTAGRSSAYLYLIEGTIQDIGLYAGTTVDWVIKVAHLICAPFGAGQVYTHTTGTPQNWYNRDRGTDWRRVSLGDPLLPGIYEFETSSPIVLSRLSDRQSRSKTSRGSESSATAFRRDIQLRDGVCVVTGALSSFVASHLIPKRMGTDGAKTVVTEFVGAQAALGVHRFHPMIGILLLKTLDDRVDQYTLGFYHNTDDTYTLHNFETDQDVTIVGFESSIFSGPSVFPRLHLHQMMLSVHGGNEPLPPKGVFDWHYLQCVAKRFATSDYKTVPGIYFHVYPFKTADDESDDEFEFEDNGEAEPPYPTYRFDRFLAEQGRIQRMHERAQEVARWSAGVAEEIVGTGDVGESP
ncbi:unnamed protein product [Cyclocybe aegerita]|uniref:Uncharacterized protein n=1 Tax=Cyclocybe aegerita TaxID=1973307 RepID=A0A8S0WFX5_CYCAE|nr:unnamed protein product [Cyclocybe aegerita]